MLTGRQPLGCGHCTHDSDDSARGSQRLPGPPAFQRCGGGAVRLPHPRGGGSLLCREGLPAVPLGMWGHPGCACHRWRRHPQVPRLCSSQAGVCFLYCNLNGLIVTKKACPSASVLPAHTWSYRRLKYNHHSHGLLTMTCSCLFSSSAAILMIADYHLIKCRGRTKDWENAGTLLVKLP